MIKRALTERLICALLIGGFVVAPSKGMAAGQASQAADQKQAQVQAIINTAEMHYTKGRTAYDEGEYDRARREFDQAVDVILNEAIDVRSDDSLRAYYRKLIEEINRFQIASLEQKDGGFSEQRYEPSPLDKIATLSEADLEEAGPGDGGEEVAEARFNFNFSAAHPVKQFISYFTKGRGRATMSAGFMRSVRYRQMAESIFKEEGVPTDLIWLAQVESGWNPYAFSSAAAKGIWQFIPATGTRFGLAQNYWIDERSNPEKSTRAAARYLKWLSNRYQGNWQLALAAYNTGEGNVDSAIRRSGTRDFWKMHGGGYLAQETRNYVPAILAVVTIAKNPKKYGFEMPPAFASRYETRTIASQTDLKPLAKKLKVSFGTLLDMNPELQRGMTPPGKHVIRIPASVSAAAASADDSSGN
ncbi:MAG TPA: transglycosylase SLT domain-containing protein [Blastocatellia bacterium]|nr:transglycosylase SLT domain-containing protein [Blastocatellia bacterium]